MNTQQAFLIDMEGRIVNTWNTDCKPALGAYLLDNGHLLRPGMIPRDEWAMDGPGAGGRIQEFTWEGEVVWDFMYASPRQLPHHDITRLPNGNVLLIVYDEKTVRESLNAGSRGKTRLRPDCIVEVKPTGKTTGKVVWEWHVWDHLIQDHDATKANYGDVAAHPELIDLNFGEVEGIKLVLARKGGTEKLHAIGYVRANSKRPLNPPWTYINSVAYNPELDQIMLSALGFSEIWVIDHSTTTAEAAGHRGGRGGKGGDLLYRWGNPRAYRAGTAEDRKFFSQHAAHWISRGLPGQGHLLVFNNGIRSSDGFSSVEEIVLPVDAEGHYIREGKNAFGPENALWSFTTPSKTDFYSEFLSSAERLPNGNTLICSGMEGRIFEVTKEGEVVWDYRMPAPLLPGSAFVRSSRSKTRSVFRASRYAPDHPALAGRKLTPGLKVEELRPKEEKTTKKK